MKKQWYEILFENYAKSYDNEPFTQGTIGEVDFIEKELQYDKALNLLDVGCGTGRHSIELAKRGYQVTGIDLSENQLKRAREKATEAGVRIDFIQADARHFTFNQKFDAVIMICEGGFSLMETDAMNFEILKHCQMALKKGGKLIFTTLNALFPLYHSTEKFLNEGAQKVKVKGIDLMTLREKQQYEGKNDDGKTMHLQTNERYYMPSEIHWLLESLGFSEIEIFGCELGNFSREKKLATEDYEMLVIARL